MNETPRQRATAIVERDGRVLLVRDKWRPAFMLPGGGIDEGESPEVAIERELREETTLTATAVQYLFTHDASTTTTMCSAYRLTAMWTSRMTR